MIRLLDENTQKVLLNKINTELENDELCAVTTSVSNKLDYESEPLSDQTKTSSNNGRSKRKRDNPLVLAEDNLIRNWCEMHCTKCPELFDGFTFKEVKVHYDKEHGINGFLLCCDKKFFRRVRALEHIARHINPSVFR